MYTTSIGNIDQGATMGWLGKVIGGVVGGVAAGPIGAIAGIALGHAMDAAGTPQAAPPAEDLSESESAQMAFFVSTFSMLAKLAKADGRVSREEIAAIDRFIREGLELDGEGREFAIQIFRAAKDADIPFEQHARTFHQLFGEVRPLLTDMLDVLVRLAAADGELHAEEQRMIESAVRIFGLSREEYEQVHAIHFPDRDRWYRVLGLQSTATVEEIKQRYRKLAVEYHPDRLMSKGLPEELVGVAENRMREFNHAYEQLRQERQFR